MLALMERPEVCKRSRAHPELLAAAAEEILRGTTPVRVLRRTLIQATEMRGKKLREGESALLLYTSANRDEAPFDEPFELRIARRPNEHLSFGIGPHYCPGANLARMEMATVVGMLLEHLPDLRLAPRASVREGRNPILSTIEEMPVVFTPREA